MAQYTGPDPNTLLPGDPWTSALAQAAFEDPIAIAEGAPGAPRIANRALKGLITNAFQVSSDSWGGLVDLADYNEIVFTGSYLPINISFGSAFMQARFSTDNGSTWGTAQDLYSTPTEQDNEGPITIHINIDTGQFTLAHHIDVNSGTATVPASANGIQLRASSLPGGGNLRLVPRLVGGRS